MNKKSYTTSNINYEDIGKALKKGELIIYPTDTVYGIGGVIESQEAIEKIYKVKERNFNSPLIALVSDVSKIEEIAYINEKNREKIEKLINVFWPGGLTIILNRRGNVPDIMVAGGKTIGVRMPKHEAALEIINSAGGLLPTTSANISGEATPRSYDELSEEFKSRVEIVVDGGKCPIGNASTIIDMSDEPKILRIGAISVSDIVDVIGKI